MNPTEIKAALATLGGGANKRLGQHFLIDQAALETIAGAALLRPGLLTLEVGPGLGVLTRALHEKGCEVTAIERDSRFVEYLTSALTGPAGVRVFRSRFHRDEKTFTPSPVSIVRGDAAEIDWMTVVSDREWQLISNLPYAISSLALRKALWSTRPAENVVVLVQREVGERAMNKNKTSLLSLMVALASSSVRILRRVPPGAFFPPPKVDSVVLQITPMPWPERMERWGIDPEEIMKIAKLGFAHPRKLLASNLKPLVGAQRLCPGPIDLTMASIPEKARAEDLSPDQWAALARYLKGS